MTSCFSKLMKWFKIFKIWISLKWVMTFPSKKKILKLCFKGYIFRSYQFLAEEPFNLLTADFFFFLGGGGRLDFNIFWWFSLNADFTPHEKCPSELFWSVFSRIRTEYGEIWMWENTEQNNSKYSINYNGKFRRPPITLIKSISY